MTQDAALDWRNSLHFTYYQCPGADFNARPSNLPATLPQAKNVPQHE
jgi:hypothetical protein